MASPVFRLQNQLFDIKCVKSLASIPVLCESQRLTYRKARTVVYDDKQSHLTKVPLCKGEDAFRISSHSFANAVNPSIPNAQTTADSLKTLYKAVKRATGRYRIPNNVCTCPHNFFSTAVLRSIQRPTTSYRLYSTESNSGRNNTSIFVGNLDTQLSRLEVHEQLLSHFPGATGVSVSTHTNNRVKGYAFVYFKTTSDVEAILSNPSYTEFNGRVVTIQRAINRGDQRLDVLYVANLNLRGKSHEIKDRLHKHFPTAKNVRVPTDVKGKLYGYAFVTFANSDEVDTVLADPEYKDLDDTTLHIERARKLGDTEKAGSLYVGNIGWEVREDVVKSHLESQFPTATAVSVPLKPDNNSEIRGFAFVKFGTMREVKDILAEDKVMTFNGRKLILQMGNTKPSSWRSETRSEDNRVCFFCGEVGHISTSCPRVEKPKSEDSQRSAEQV